ncbi:MAG: hypothetical protein GY835_27105 [bacterium]|nr:hypothetical protein [bacterium]
MMNKSSLLAVCIIALCLLPTDGLALKTISGSITTDTTLDTVGGAIYQVTGSITVNNGVTLTIDPGVVLKFNIGTRLTVDGNLQAVGGPLQDEQIYFTSIYDDNAPAPFGDDTNLDGNATIPEGEDWSSIIFNDLASDASHLRYCSIFYAGRSNTGSIICNDASPTIEDCQLLAGHYGVRCNDESHPILRNTEINAMDDVPVAISIESDPTFDNLAFESSSDNGFDAIGILGGTLMGSNTLRIRGATLGVNPIDNIVYILLSDFTVDGGGQLTIDPGVVIKPKTSVDINVYGTLIMNGTADPDSQIVMTSFKDDNYGVPGDTNNDGSTTSPAMGNWGIIDFKEGSGGSIVNATLRFGGSSSRGMIRTFNTSPVFAMLTISDTWYGIEQGGISASVISGCSVSNTTYTPFLMSVSSDPIYAGNTFTNVGLAALGIIGETIGVDSVLKVRTVAGFDNITYWLSGTLNMSIGAHLRIEPGVVVKARPYSYSINIDGSLQADATPDSLIVFTSQYDDLYGTPADTEGNGTATTPTFSNWSRIKFNPTSDDARCVLDNCVLSYGGYYSYNYHGVLWCSSASPTVTNCEFSTNRTGIRIDGGSEPTIADCNFFNNQNVPLAVSVVSDPTFTDNTFNQNQYHAVGIISETLAEDAVLEVVRVGGPPQFADYFPYYHLGTLTIGSGSLLRVEPGVVMKSDYSNFSIDVAGGLYMPGTADSIIVLTSIKDDSFGGDSNVDGSSTSPASGNYRGIRFRSTTMDAESIIDHTLFRFGGSYDGVVEMQSASPTIRNCEFEINDQALWIQNQSDPVVTDNLFRLTAEAPISKSLLAEPTFSGNVYNNNAYDCLGLIGEDVAQDLTLRKWDLAGFTNITRTLVDGTLEVNLGSKLTIDSGIVLKLGQYHSGPFARSIIVEGAVEALGTAMEPIVFTSIRDDEYGNPADTNNDGGMTSPSASDWQRITFTDVSNDAENLMQHCLFRFGGYSGYAVRIQTASPTFDSCTFESNNDYGMRIEGDSQPVITDCIFDNHDYTPIVMSLVSEPVFSGIHFLPGNGYSALGILGETLASDVVWPRRSMAQTANIPYVLTGSLTVGLSSILRIEPGVVIKPTSGANITVKRGLIAEGTADPEGLIVFTSTRDDFYGGDTNNDSTLTTGSSQRWGYISIANEAIDDSTRFSNCVFRYASNSNSYGALDITNANPQISNSIFSHNGNGLNYKGAAGDPTKGQVVDCDIFNNSYHGIKNTGMSFTISANSCWWGHATGPYDPLDDTGSGGLYNPGGLGDEVTNMVDYSGWLTGGIENILLGDVSLNGDIRAYDASLVLQDLAALITLTPRQELIADVNCSGGHSVLDASYILRYVAGLDPYFPCAYEEVVTKRIPFMREDYDFVCTEEGDFRVDLPTVNLLPGETTLLPINVSGDGDLLGHEYRLAFDSARMSIDNVRLLPAAQGAMLFWNVADNGELCIALASAELLPVSAAVEIELRGAPDLPGSVPADIALAYARLNEQVIVESNTGVDGTVPAAFNLGQNHPNPFNPSTIIEFAIPESDGVVKVALRVFDLRGREIRCLVDETRAPGLHSVLWDGRDASGERVSSGVYLYRLTAGTRQSANKMVMVK